MLLCSSLGNNYCYPKNNAQFWGIEEWRKVDQSLVRRPECGNIINSVFCSSPILYYDLVNFVSVKEKVDRALPLFFSVHSKFESVVSEFPLNLRDTRWFKLRVRREFKGTKVTRDSFRYLLWYFRWKKRKKNILKTATIRFFFLKKKVLLRGKIVAPGEARTHNPGIAHGYCLISTVR